MLLKSTVPLAIRGRGLREYPRAKLMLVSKAGAQIPQLIAASEVEPGDYVGVRYGVVPPVRADLPHPEDRPLICAEKRIRVPETMTPALAFFLGAYLSEGHTTRSNWSVILTNSVAQVLEDAQSAIGEVFGLRARLTHQPNRCTGLVVSSKRLVEYMDLLECGSRARNKRVPPVMFGAPDDLLIPFLQGVALDAYSVSGDASKWAICLESSEAIDGLQEIVTGMGIPNSQIKKFNKDMQKYYFELYAAGPCGQEMCRRVPFLEPDKAERAQRLQAMAIRGGDNTDVIPGITGMDLYQLIPRGNSGRNGAGTGRQRFRYLCDPRTRHVTRDSVQRAAEAGAELPDWLRTMTNPSLRFYPVMDHGPMSDDSR